jgi:hypothetical protein
MGMINGHGGSRRDLTNESCVNCWTGAPRSPLRTWDENDGAKPLFERFQPDAQMLFRESSPT